MKRLGDFALQRDGRYGRHAHCRSCVSEKQKERRPKYAKRQAERWATRNEERRLIDAERNLKFCRLHRVERNAAAAVVHANKRAVVIERYGGKCECCQEDIPEFLAIDHRNGGGKVEQRAIGGPGILDKLYKSEIIFPGYRLLCHNCNSSYGSYGYCPHCNLEMTVVEACHPYFGTPSTHPQAVKGRRYRLRMRLGVIERYGGLCICCDEERVEFLSIEHLNQDGAEERKTRGSHQIYTKLFHAPEILAGYGLLCHNCNLGSYLCDGQCPHKIKQVECSQQ